ncbi:SDR family NAD(P)-dependent oxidoreductase [Budvicia aquatica]|uniref:Glucose 1-dehydrogenase n=1 Tax=Budvicia aquatica TaxID=82979 RepID=A0A2C6DQ65_9GAMM|nr:SDR family oxidoreductase [Budvicia aquatica]PHI30575.1 NAD(P)-dependent oxidoreductase [Budvicia aquatica]GKX49938.1 short-chain dehydrogenase [Budvicia aquatica]VFS49962.1 Glucose 1-dehydrogenase [Budvicia aquatica]
MNFAEKVVIVTGGGSGIGLETVKAFAQHGASVMIADVSEQGPDIALSLQQKGYQVRFVKTDVTSLQDQENMLAETLRQFRRLDILFANAGIARDGPIDSLSVDNWQKTIDVNLTGVFLSNKVAISHWLNAGQRGVIVNCGSIHSFVGKQHVTAYAAAKGGVKLLTETLAADYAAKGIRVNAVCPGYIDTPLLSALTSEQKDALIKLHPQGRLGHPNEVANVVLFLAGDMATFVNGASVLVDGGYTSQ